jgi:PEP-CTERM motif-containing protein
LLFTSDEVSIQSTYWFYDKTVSDTDLFVQVYYGPDGEPRGYPVGIGFNDKVSSATPLPATLPLFATGLGAMGLLGWRRKRKGRKRRLEHTNVATGFEGAAVEGGLSICESSQNCRMLATNVHPSKLLFSNCIITAFTVGTELRNVATQFGLPR